MRCPGWGRLLRRWGGWSCLAMLVATAGCGGDSPTQGEVVVYCSVDQNIAEPILAEFTRQTGVKVLARYDTEASKTVGLVERLRAQGAKPLADVFWSSEVFHTIRLARDDILTRYDSRATRDWPARFTGADRRWYGFALRGRVIAYNTRRVSAEEAPRRLEDLLDEKWRGRIVMASPVAGTTQGDVASWFAGYGVDEAEAILKGLKANEVRLVGGNSTSVQAVGQGQADVGLTDTDDVHAAVRNGYPVAMFPLDQGGEGSLAIPNTVGLIRGAPHPAPAGRLIDFLLSEPVEVMLARSDSHNAPIRPALADRFAEYRISRPLDIDYQRVADHLPRARAAWEILR